jgi:hypothetical protein
MTMMFGFSEASAAEPARIAAAAAKQKGKYFICLGSPFA